MLIKAAIHPRLAQSAPTSMRKQVRPVFAWTAFVFAHCCERNAFPLAFSCQNAWNAAISPDMSRPSSFARGASGIRARIVSCVPRSRMTFSFDHRGTVPTGSIPRHQRKKIVSPPIT